MAMNEEVKAKWIKALRSGEYKQTAGLLHRTRDGGGHKAGYCCLGVLCKVQGLEESFVDGDYAGEFKMPEEFGGEVLRGLPSYNYMRSLDVPDGWRVLTELNDYGKSFAEIADYIEEYL